MRTWRAVLMVAVLAATAGCTDEPRRDPEPEVPADGDVDQGDVVIVTDLASAGCRAVEILVPTTAADAQRHLPEGLAPAPHQLANDGGMFVLRLYRCDEAASLAPHGGLEAAVLIQAPPVPENVTTFDAANRTDPAAVDRVVDLYLIAGYNEAQAWIQVLRAAGVPGGQGNTTLTLAAPPAPGVAEGSAQDEDGALMEFRAVPAPSGDASELRRSWRQSEHGLMLIEQTVGSDAGAAVPRSFGPAFCTLRPGSPLEPVGGGAVCGEAFAETLAYEAPTRAFWFHEMAFSP